MVFASASVLLMRVFTVDLFTIHLYVCIYCVASEGVPPRTSIIIFIITS